MDRTLFINGLTFLAFDLFIFWRITDPRPAKEKIKYYFGLKSIMFLLFTLAFFLLNYLSGMYFPLPRSGFDELITLFGVIIFFSGSLIAVWAKLTMGKVWGVPGQHEQVRQNKLIKQGPFKYSRNPIYLGLSMVLIGYGLALQSSFSFLALIPVVYFWSSSVKEEKLLEKYFKEEYLKYKKEVPRFF